MDREKYERMQSIVQFGRLASDAMRNAMKNAGLLDEGFWFEINVRNIHLQSTDEDMVGSVRLFKPYDGQNRHDEDFYQMNITGKGWEIIDDPITKTGIASELVKPCDVDPEGKAESGTAGKTASEHPLPPDGLWISSRDDPADVGGGK